VYDHLTGGTHRAFSFSANNRLFSLRGERCTLKIVCNRSTNWVIAALLMLQLVISMQWQVAHANMGPPERQAKGMDARPPVARTNELFRPPIA